MDSVDPIEFKRTYVDRQDPRNVQSEYDRKLDTLFIDLQAPSGPRSTYYIKDGVHIVFDPTTSEIVGFRVEDWQLVFLRQHSDLRLSWYVYRALCRLQVLCDWLNLPARDRVVERVEQYAPSLSPA